MINESRKKLDVKRFCCYSGSFIGAFTLMLLVFFNARVDETAGKAV
jgi:hypothetical protein